WVLAEVARYLRIAGQSEWTLPAAESCRHAASCDNPIEAYLRRCDYGEGLLASGRVTEALRALPEPDRDWTPDRAKGQLLLAEAHWRAGNLSEAHDWLQQASELIEARPIERLRPQFNALAQRF